MRSVETRQLLIYFGYFTVEPRQSVDLGLSNPDKPCFVVSDNNYLFLIVNLVERLTFCHFKSFEKSLYRFPILPPSILKVIRRQRNEQTSNSRKTLVFTVVLTTEKLLSCLTFLSFVAESCLGVTYYPVGPLKPNKHVVGASMVWVAEQA